jgi:AraC family transcriptional regulator
MPLHYLYDHGTKADGSVIEDYCRYCYKDGHFTSNCSMEEMIELCSRFIDVWNREAGRTISKKEAVAIMRVKFPLLKRWANKEETQNEYFKSVGKVLDYLKKHSDENPDIETLAGIACLSPFHFHRVFKSVIGENIGEFRLRLRMEYVAEKLNKPNVKLEDLAIETGYNGVQALSKAFRKYYGVSPSVYRHSDKKYSFETGSFGFPVLKPEIIRTRHINIICSAVLHEKISPENFQLEWNALLQFVHKTGLSLSGSEAIGVSNNDGFYYIGYIIDKPIFTDMEPYFTKTLEAGLYAVFTLNGSYKKFSGFYKTILFDWLPASGYSLRKGSCFEKYINNPMETEEDKLITEIYLPIALKD